MPIAEGDWVTAIVEGRERHRQYTFRIFRNRSYSTFAGSFKGDQAIGLEWGSELDLEKGKAYLLRPTVYDMINHVLPRRSQVVYPKDAAYIAAAAGLVPGMRVLEAGAGSGFLTIWAAIHVCPTGHVVSYDVRDDMLKLASDNVSALGLSDCVDLKKGDVRAGVQESNIDALLLDVPDPWEALRALWPSLRLSAPAVVFVPTANQVSKLLLWLQASGGYVVQEVVELIKREWEHRGDALRPAVRMIGHTGFIILLRRTLSRRADPNR